MVSNISHTSLFGGVETVEQNNPPPQATTNHRPKPLPGAQDSSQPWTATRCHRLLRPLRTHVAALRREVERGSSENHGLNSVSQSSKRSLSELGFLPPRKKVRYTYSLKSSKQASQLGSRIKAQVIVKPTGYPRKVSQPGEIVVPTPVLRRVTGQQLSSPVQQTSLPIKSERRPRPLCSFPGFPTRSPLEEELALLRKNTLPSRYTLYESIFRALEALLRATTEEPKETTTSKSLMGMCLRKVPQYLSELEWWENKDAEESGTKSAIQGSKVSFEVYSDLESISPVEGWKYLRIVVRSHGAKTVTDAISEGLFDTSFSGLLAKLCAYWHACLEAEELLEALTNQHFPRPEGPDDEFAATGPLAPLKFMLRFAHESGRTGFMFRRMSSLLESGQLPHEWLSAQEFGAIWSTAARAISGTSNSEGALRFAATSLTLLCNGDQRNGLPAAKEGTPEAISKSSRQTFISTLAVLAVMPILGQEALSNTPDALPEGKLHIMSRRVIFILKSCLAETRTNRGEEVKRRRHLLELALSLIATDGRTVHNSTVTTMREQILASMTRGEKGPLAQKPLYDDAIALVAAVAQCYGRGMSTPSHTYLLKLCDHLSTLDLPKGLMKRIRSDGAFLLADRTNDLRDLAFAEGMHTHQTPATRRTTTLEQSSSDKALFSGYRWDKSISEWVGVSPVLNFSKRLGPQPIDVAANGGRDRRMRPGSSGLCDHRDTVAASGLATSRRIAVETHCDHSQECGSSEEDLDHHTQAETRRRHRGIRPGKKLGKRRVGAGGLLSLVPDDELCLEEVGHCGKITARLSLGKARRKRLSRRPPLRSNTDSWNNGSSHSDDELCL